MVRSVQRLIGKIAFYNQKGELLVDEYVRNRKDMFGNTCSSLEVEAREFKPITGGDYRLTMRFVSTPEEKIYGMGQYQQPYLDVKGADLELAHRNSQASVPFMLSSLGYGFLWNNPAVGRVNFGKNITTWEARSTKKLDYWITAGDSPAEIEEAAKIDGCSRVAIFLRIILPMSKPGLASLAIFTFVNSWKSFFWPLIVTSSDKYKTLPIGLYAFSGQYGTDWSALMAATAISIIPGVIFYIIFQKSLVEGISLTGMGGR